MRVALISGVGQEGRSALEYWTAKGAEITICDSRPDVEIPDGVASQLGSDYLNDLERFDLIVRSPGVHPHLLPQNIPTTSVVNEFMAVCPAPIFGVTGTKGKGTTASLLAEMLKAAGKTVHLGGNIGVPALDLLDKIQPDDIVVLELSSFQLMDAKKSPHVSICLMIAPEHLDYHADEQEYWDAKGNIFAHQSADDIAIYNKNNQMAMDLAYTSAGTKIPYDAEGVDKKGAYVSDEAIWYQDTRICSVSDVALLGRHNLQNVCAALAAAWHETQDVSAIAQAIREFQGLPYRLQDVATVNGARYINDSFGVQPDAAVAALQTFNEPKVIILGGVNRNISYAQLAETVSKSSVRGVILMGETANILKAELESHGVESEVINDGMKAVVTRAAQMAQSGDVVLLSPGCPSFDMFKDYIDRGDQFTAAVKELV